MTPRAQLQMLEERAVLWEADWRPPGQGRLEGQRRRMKPAEVRELRKLRRQVGSRWNPATSQWRPFVERLADRRVR